MSFSSWETFVSHSKTFLVSNIPDNIDKMKTHKTVLFVFFGYRFFMILQREIGKALFLHETINSKQKTIYQLNLLQTRTDKIFVYLDLTILFLHILLDLHSSFSQSNNFLAIKSLFSADLQLKKSTKNFYSVFEFYL